MISLINKITVDLIHDHDNIVFFADVSSLAQFFFCPYSANRVVRIAQDKYFYIVIYDLLFKIFKINGVFSIFIMQLVIYKNSSVIFDHFAEWIVNRLLDQKRIAFFMHYNDYIMSAHQYGDNYTLTMMEVHTLSYIEDHPGTSSGELIQYWDKTKGTISQILTKLEKLELIEKRKKDGNAKNLYLYVTAEGSRVSKAHKMYDILDIAKTMSQLQKQCSAEEIEAFYHVISVYNEVIKKDFEINKSPRKRTDVTPLP